MRRSFRRPRRAGRNSPPSSKTVAFLALDLSKRSAGWALWHQGLDRPACGTWELGSELTSPGMVFARLHENITGIHGAMAALTSVHYERPLDPGTLGRQTNFDIPFLLIGLAAHVESWCCAMGVRHCQSHHQATWRRHFIGKMPRGTKSMTLKDFAVDQCKQLGILPGRHDAAEAVGILDFALHLAGIMPPWRDQHVLTVQMVGGRR